MTEASARILTELEAAAQTHADWAALPLAAVAKIHIAIMSEPFLSYMLEGQKTVESRFSLHKIAPYGVVQAADLVFLKAGRIVGCFTVDWVRSYDLVGYPIAELIQEYNDAICGNQDFWQRKSQKRYATLMGIKDVQQLTPTAVTKLDQRAWVTL